MYVNSGYLNNSRLPFKDKSKPLIVGSCGTYRLKTKEKLPTWRPRALRNSPGLFGGSSCSE